MPYIPKEDRKQYHLAVANVIHKLDRANWDAGHINFVIYSILKAAWIRNASYSNGNKLIGVLASVSAEFYRRFLVPHEDNKKEDNGDV